ncbi:nucleotide pyrophosphohydrolase [Acidobacteriota bacterium]
MNFDLTDCARRILEFRDRRDWKRFHTPKNLAVSISIEAAELLELFQWKDSNDTVLPDQENARAAVEDEIADIAIYLLLLCADQEVDLRKAIERKITKNDDHYPVNKARGRADKYTKL